MHPTDAEAVATMSLPPKRKNKVGICVTIDGGQWILTLASLDQEVARCGQ